MGFFPGERIVSGMSLGKKNSMYGSFKGAPRKQFRGFHAAAQSLFIRGLQLRTAITFTSKLRFGSSWTLYSLIKFELILGPKFTKNSRPLLVRVSYCSYEASNFRRP